MQKRKIKKGKIMQIIIDIPEKIIKEAKESPNYYPTYQFETIWKSICNGTVLPKHGRLIDGDALEKLCFEHEIGNEMFSGEPIIEQGYSKDGDIIWKSLFGFASTILEATKE